VKNPSSFAALLTSLAIFTACSTPEESARADAAAHQRKLAEQARENLDREREREAERRADIEEARANAAEDAADRARDIAEKRADAAEDAARLRAYEVEYARQLGKKPSQLTPSERAWIRDKYD
jgi:hypothetical protein